MKPMVLFPAGAAALALTACAGGGILAADPSQFTVNSKPQGAEIYVMGKLAGNTPMTIRTKSIFPGAYGDEQSNQYGRIRLVHGGCAERVVPVDNAVLYNGLNVELDCGSEKTPVSSGHQKTGAAERLRRLETLRDEGLINDREYREKRRSIIDAL